MIDTIQIKIPKSAIHIEHESFFCDETSKYKLGRDDYTQQKRTNWEFYKKKQSEHIYVPKFWLEHTTWNPTPDYLVLEFSIPKFLFNTSLYSVKEIHFDSLIEKLLQFLRYELHVKTDEPTIKKSIITQLALCKNVRLDDLCTARQAITILEKINYLPLTNAQKIIYENDSGHGIKYYNTARSLAVYEKLPEIANNAVTGLEIEVARQWKKNGFVELEHQKPLRQAIRFELTLQNKKAVNQSLKPLIDKTNGFTLSDVFQNGIAEKLLFDILDELLNHPARDFIFVTDFTHPLLITAIRKNVKTRMHENEMIAVMRGIQDLGIKGYRKQFLDSGITDRTWRNRCRVLKEISKELDWQQLPRASERDIILTLMNEIGITPKHIKPEQLTLI